MDRMPSSNLPPQLPKKARLTLLVLAGTSSHRLTLSQQPPLLLPTIYPLALLSLLSPLVGELASPRVSSEDVKGPTTMWRERNIQVVTQEVENEGSRRSKGPLPLLCSEEETVQESSGSLNMEGLEQMTFQGWGKTS